MLVTISENKNVMKNIYETKYFGLTIVIILSLLITSCSSIGLLDKNDSWLVFKINGIGDFFKVYITLQISILIVSFFLSFLLSQLGYIIAIILHFIWIVAYRDYGFFIVLLLFGVFTSISILINVLFATRRNSRY